MKSVIAAIGALAFAATAAHAAEVSTLRGHSEAMVAPRHAMIVDTGHRSADRSQAAQWSTNRGIGTSRSSDANNG